MKQKFEVTLEVFMAVKGKWFTDDEEREDLPNVEFRHQNEEVGQRRKCDRR